MLRKVGTWFKRHWFVGVLAIVAVLWLVVGIAYSRGVTEFSVRSRSGQAVEMDFSRDLEVGYLSLERDAVLEIETRPGTPLRSSIYLTGPTPVPLCWLCGSRDTTSAIAQVEFRSGPWFFRSPIESWPSGLETWAERPRDAYRALAYDSATGARVLAVIGDSVEEQLRLLAESGLAPAESARLSPATLADLETASVMREGCMVIHGAFIAAFGLWIVGGGPFALASVRRRRARSGLVPLPPGAG
jgi:hypothetical protein